MRHLTLHPKKKFRGIKRHLKKFQNALKDLECISIKKWNDNNKYWNKKICIYERLLSYNERTTKAILNQYIESAYKCYLNNKNKDETFTLIISYPEIFSSEICLFYDQDYFSLFQNRNNEYQKWEKQNVGIIELLSLTIPENAEIINYKETITDEDYNYSGLVTIIIYR